jgi:MFS transporter, PAT family, solute carrier family 33 (acetyl-CoA transportor), member 1
MLLNVINNSFSFILYLSIGSFTSQISDKSIGGTYMTFLSLWGGLGMIISRTLVLFLTDTFTFKNCKFDPNDVTNKNLAKYLINNISNYLKNNTCSNEYESKICKEYGGQCVIYFDALYLLTFIFVAIGFIWLVFSRELIQKLQLLPKSVWLVSSEDKMSKKNQEIISI